MPPRETGLQLPGVTIRRLTDSLSLGYCQSEDADAASRKRWAAAAAVREVSQLFRRRRRRRHFRILTGIPAGDTGMGLCVLPFFLRFAKRMPRFSTVF